jgi:hypothetical protein
MKLLLLPITLPILAAGIAIACSQRHEPSQVVTAAPPAQAEAPAMPVTTIGPDQQRTVFVIGKTYHTGKCTLLASKATRTAMPIEHAREEGFTPCRRCNPASAN